MCNVIFLNVLSLLTSSMQHSQPFVSTECGAVLPFSYVCML
jgi:hypothetical protein